MNYDNEMQLKFKASSENEALARTCAAAFILNLNPTVTDLNDIKTAVSEAVTNAIIHGYDGISGYVEMRLKRKNNTIYIEIEDVGKGIEDIKMAMTALYTSKPDLERSGMGFTVMETFMDSIEVLSEKDRGTIIKMTKEIIKPWQAG